MLRDVTQPPLDTLLGRMLLGAKLWQSSAYGMNGDLRFGLHTLLIISLKPPPEMQQLTQITHRDTQFFFDPC